MPWQTPTLRQVREQNRDYIVSRIKAPLIPNSTPRAVADAQGGLAHGVYKYMDWLALQLMADTCEQEWLDRQANIWLVNADGTNGRKGATSANGMVTFSGTVGAPVAAGITLTNSSATTYQVLTGSIVGNDGTVTLPVIALDPGSDGNAEIDDRLTFASPVTAGLNGLVTVVDLSGGTDEESDDELRVRLLQRIREPPMGGDAADYVKWSLSFPGCTRAWTSPLEMGIGTVTLRFMMDDLRSSNGGFPLDQDVSDMQTWLDSVRPVTVLDLFVVAPIPEPVSFTISNLDPDTSDTLAQITISSQKMIFDMAKPAFAHNGISQPAQTIYAVWMSDAVMRTIGVNSFDFAMTDHEMPSPGHMGVLGNILRG